MQIVIGIIGLVAVMLLGYLFVILFRRDEK
ncbi:MAG: hypothetical protein K0Q85_1531 [Caproiciproducens sp.]|nr:hypothetical protein [Caproiciproducens sp.]